TRWPRDWSSDVCSSDLAPPMDRDHHPPGALRRRSARRHRLAQTPILEANHRRRPPPVKGGPEQIARQLGLRAEELLEPRKRHARSEERRVGKEVSRPRA